MRVLLTGGSGFVGSHTARRLLSEGHEVALVLRQPSKATRLKDILDRTVVVESDLERITDCRDIITDFNPEAVVHTAWAGVAGKDRNDLGQVDNITASTDLMRLSVEIGVRYFLGFGSQAEYGPCPARVDETQRPAPTTLYGGAKLATGMNLSLMAAQTGMGFCWLRLFSSYGPDDSPAWVISYLVDTFLAGQRPSLTECEQMWDFIYIEDVAGAVAAALSRRAEGTFNLGSGTAVPLRDVVTFIRDRIDPDLEIGFGDVPYRPDQVMHLEANIEALEAATGWSPQVALNDGLARTIAGRRGIKDQ